VVNSEKDTAAVPPLPSLLPPPGVDVGVGDALRVGVSVGDALGVDVGVGDALGPVVSFKKFMLGIGWFGRRLINSAEFPSSILIKSVTT